METVDRKKFRSGYWLPVAARHLCASFNADDTNDAVHKLAASNEAGPVLAELIAEAMAYAYRQAHQELEMME